MGEPKKKNEKRSRTKPKRNGERPLGALRAKQYAIYKAWSIEKKNEWLNKINGRSKDNYVNFDPAYLNVVVPFKLPETEDD